MDFCGIKGTVKAQNFLRFSGHKDSSWKKKKRKALGATGYLKITISEDIRRARGLKYSYEVLRRISKKKQAIQKI